MHIFFVPLYDFFKKRKPIFWIIFLSSFALWGILAANIKLEEDISSMLPDSKAVRTMNDVVGNTSAADQLIFVLAHNDSTYSDPDSLATGATAFTNQLNERFSDYIDTIVLQPGSGYEQTLVNIVQQNLPLFLEEEDYKKLDSLTQPEKIRQTLEANKRVLLSPASVFYKKLVATDPLGISGIAWNKLKSLQGSSNYEVYDNYLYYKDLSKLTFFVEPTYKASETGKNATFFSDMDQFIEDWEKENTGLTVTYFGGAAVAAGNATQMRTDTIVTLSVTIILLLILTFYFFRRKRVPLLLLVPVVYGGAMGLGIISLVQGSISVIALGAGAIIMGIAIDFSIHFLSHVRKSNDLRATVKELSQPLTLGSFTTVAAFLSLRLVDTPILQDLGLFAATSLLGAALCTLIFLPHLPIGSNKVIKERSTIFDKLATLRPESNKWMILSIFLLTPVMLYFSSDVSFDSDLMNLNYMSPKLKAAQEEVSKVNASALRSMYVISEGPYEETALKNMEQIQESISKLNNAGVIKSTTQPISIITSKATQRERIQRWKDYWKEDKVEQVLKSIYNEATAVGFSQTAFSSFETNLTKDYQPFDTDAETTIKSLFPNGFAEHNNKHYTIATLKVPFEERERVFKELSEHKDVIVTDRQQGATQLVDILNNDFTDIAIYSSLIVFAALLIGYGRIELAVIAFLPMAISWVWILGLMAILGLKFNIVNIIISSLIFGLGDDYTIFTMDGLVERLRTGKKKLASVRAAVYISALTVVIGLGVLLLAKHPALRSIAFISVTGLVCVLFISQTLQPFLFNKFIQHRADKKLLPFTVRSFCISVFTFLYFFTGSLILTILGIILTRLWPFNMEKGKYYYHVLISSFTRSLIYIAINLKKKVYNLANEDFQKPAVFIANHTSFLDILITTMLHPKLVLLTNRWVWKSPVFGAVVRMGEYYPVADGAEDSIEPLRDLTDRGYSIVVFPEGTRSYTDKIARFHKGAFYIAEQLQLDVVPVLLHGVHYSMQKGDWLLKDGTCSIYIYPHIKPNDTTYGETYSEKAKHMGRWMRKELQAAKVKHETPGYFREQLQRSYTYKGPVLEWYCRVKIKLENYYEDFHKLLPREGIFYDLGCGYGFMTYMLHWAAPERKFTGIDYDDDKIETAQNNFLKDDHINFEQGDLTQLELQPCDGMIISDVLHYLLPQQQENLLKECARVLNPNGCIIIRDGISELQDRIKGTKMTEVFSTRIFKFNKTQNELHFISRTLIENFAARHGMSVEVHDNAKVTANLTFVLKKPAT